MFFGYALDDAIIHMKSVWARPTSPAVLGTVVAVATVAMLLVRAGVL
jgi:hypothetical protein